MKKIKEDENIHLQHQGRVDFAICGLCGTVLDKDDESGEYRCSVCDVTCEQ